jgi:hypothetical protein
MSCPAPATVLHAVSHAVQLNSTNAINLFTIYPPVRRFLGHG